MSDLDKEDDILFKYLDELVKACDNHEHLCRLAYNFRQSPASKRLSEHIRSENHSSIWPVVRHYIGRLGSWWKACKILTTAGRTRPYLLGSSKLRLIPSFPGRTTSQTPLRTDIRDSLGRILPACDSSQVQQVLQSLQNRWGPDITEAFAERYRHRRSHPCVHAELSVLEHFHINELAFVGDDRYIGCSKPSCYCCNIYMKFHPGRCLSRPSHGNTWVKWCTPLQISIGTGSATNHTRAIMHRMVEQMQRDILSHVLSDSAPRKPILESTTGLSTSASAPLG